MTGDAVAELKEARDFVRSCFRQEPRVGIILGSGLGFFADTLSDRHIISYAEIPHFPTSTVQGHAGRLVVGKIGPWPVAVLQGRVHYYEGYSMSEVVFPVRVLGLLGVKVLLVTNAAGAVNSQFDPGDFMIIQDHVNLMGANPLAGKNLDELGPRFPDMSLAYDPDLIRMLEGCAGSRPPRKGVYAGLPGPCYETPAEIAMLRSFGVDAAGMSTVPEVIAAHHMGVKVAALSCLTNKAASPGGPAITHEDVAKTVDGVKNDFTGMVHGWIRRLGEEGRLK